MKFSSFPTYLSPAALPNGASREAQLLHALRCRCGLAVQVLGEAEDYLEKFQKYEREQQQAAGESLGIDSKILVEVVNDLCKARPAQVEAKEQKQKKPKQEKKTDF